MQLPRVTMVDVAHAAGVHQTTVSLALRNDPRLPAATREKLCSLAEKMGYRPDPLLSALNAYRHSSRPRPVAATMAFLLDFRDRSELATWRPHQLFLEGARHQAERLGYQIEVFYVRPGSAREGPRLQRVLQARGITGVILAAFTDDRIQFHMDWSQFSLVLIESQQLRLLTHMVSSDQMMIARQAVARLHELGYRRIGLAVGRRGEINHRNGFSAGYHAELALHRDLTPLPPLLIGGSIASVSAELATWVREQKPDVIASNWSVVPEALRLAGLRTPQDIVVASLDVNPASGANAGIVQNHRVVGERAVEQLGILMRTNRRGLVTPRNCTLIEGQWLDGTDVPPARIKEASPKAPVSRTRRSGPRQDRHPPVKP